MIQVVEYVTAKQSFFPFFSLINFSLPLRHINLHKMSIYARPTHQPLTIPNPDVTRSHIQHRMRGLLTVTYGNYIFNPQIHIDETTDSSLVHNAPKVLPNHLKEGSPTLRYNQLKTRLQPKQMLPFLNPEPTTKPSIPDTSNQPEKLTDSPIQTLQPKDSTCEITPILRSTRARPIIHKRDPDMFYY